METIYTLNDVTLIGKLARDPEIKQLTAKFRKGSFTIITSVEAYDKEKGKIYVNKFIRMESVHPLIIKQLETMKQNQIVYAKGYVDPQEWNNNEGIKQYKTAIVCTLLVSGDKAIVADPSNASQATNISNVTTVTAKPIQSVEERLNTPVATTASTEFGDDSFDGDEDEIPF